MLQGKLCCPLGFFVPFVQAALALLQFMLIRILMLCGYYVDDPGLFRSQ